MSKWEKVRLGDVCDTKIETLSLKDNFLIDYVDISSVDNEKKEITSYKEFKASEAPSRARQLIQKNDVLVSTVRPNLNAVAIVTSETSNTMVASTGFCVLRSGDSIDSRYLFQFTKSKTFINNLVKVAKGASYPAVSNADVYGTYIPLPPVKTQQRIANELDAVYVLLQLRKRQIEELDQLIKSVFYEMFGDPLLNEKGWETKTLDEVCELITDGTHQTPEYSDSGYIFLSSKNVTSGEIDWENVKYIPEELHLALSRRLSPRKGDILLAKNGTTGVAAIVDRAEVFDIYVSLALLRPTENINPFYLLCAVNSDATKFQFSRSLKGIGVPNLHLSEIKRAVICIPPRHLQDRFQMIYTEWKKQKSLVKQSIDETQRLFDSLMGEYFDD